MDRIAGIETEYGCLVSGDERTRRPDAWPVRVKNYLFRKARAGVIDLHYRDYEEPPGNGGFLLNGGRLYLDMGHLEYCFARMPHVARSRGLRSRRRPAAPVARSRRSA